MKKVIGIISVVLFFLVSMQSCVATVVDIDGGLSGMLLAFLMLMGGIIALVSKTSKGMVITSIVLYVFGGLIGLGNSGIYVDLQIWSVLSIVFAILLGVELLRNKERYNIGQKRVVVEDITKNKTGGSE